MASHTQFLEQEVKLDVDLTFEVPDLTGVIEGVITDRRPPVDLVATYYDTPDLRLLSRGITLRLRRDRTAGGEDLWTLKLPGGNGTATLDRHEISWPGREPAIPEEARGLVRGIVRHATLGAVTELETNRKRLALKDATGNTIGELDDDTVAVHGGRQDGLRFRQVEFELANGKNSVVEALVARLGGAGATIDHRGPKLVQALGLEPGALGDGPPPKPGPRSLLGDVVKASIAGALNRILDHEFGIRLGGDDAEAVHQTRVATRRLRSDLKTFSKVVDPVWLAHIRTDLKWIADALGEVRDLDVLTGHLEAEMSHAPPSDTRPFGELHLDLGRRRESAHATLVEAMDSDRYVTLLDRLHASAESPPFVGTARAGKKKGSGLHPDDRAQRVLPKLVRRPWRKLRRAVRTVGAHPTDQQLHQIRIRAKRLRYAAEAAAPVVGKPASRMATAVEALQTVLGDHHDAVTAEDWFRREAAAGSSIVAFTAGQMVAMQRQRQERLRLQWRGLWKSLDRKKRRRWLR
ncbi:MAG TPA: CYTH and CHAD domain-containing protein [Acidimicrobiales bacterium]|jgi:CHAD domain-containing protein|nr:CYTH and CHAD domain-containing protein [Acidimicrobiales bacterium]